METSVQVRVLWSIPIYLDPHVVLAAFFLANEYIRSLGLPGLGEGKSGKEPEDLTVVVSQRHIDVAAGKLDVDGLVYHDGTSTL